MDASSDYVNEYPLELKAELDTDTISKYEHIAFQEAARLARLYRSKYLRAMIAIAVEGVAVVALLLRLCL